MSKRKYTFTYKKMRNALLQWYHANKRDLPWRNTRDPYAIWVSEVMLQQTTVKTVTPRWHQFLVRWPNIDALAAASLDEVRGEWLGLGYYTRAKNLHAAAVKLQQEYGGRLPTSRDELIKLPGFGPYSSAAVASIAFGEAVAVVDANVERVIGRLMALETDCRSSDGRVAISQFADNLLDRDFPGDFNQAMMELGALICTSKNPDCPECPLRECCNANQAGTPESFPVRAAKEPMQPQVEAAVVIRNGDKVLLLLRPEGASFGGMWELPRVIVKDGESAATAARRAGSELASIKVSKLAELYQIKHTVMRRRIELNVFEAGKWTGEPKLHDHREYRWLTPEEWRALPRSKTQNQIAVWLEETLFN